jgi:hypothetical protein
MQSLLKELAELRGLRIYPFQNPRASSSSRCSCWRSAQRERGVRASVYFFRADREREFRHWVHIRRRDSIGCLFQTNNINKNNIDNNNNNIPIESIVVIPTILFADEAQVFAVVTAAAVSAPGFSYLTAGCFSSWSSSPLESSSTSTASRGPGAVAGAVRRVSSWLLPAIGSTKRERLPTAQGCPTRFHFRCGSLALVLVVSRLTLFGRRLG